VTTFDSISVWGRSMNKKGKSRYIAILAFGVFSTVFAEVFSGSAPLWFIDHGYHRCPSTLLDARLASLELGYQVWEGFFESVVLLGSSFRAL